VEKKKRIWTLIVLIFLITFGGIWTCFKITYSYFGENLTGQLGDLSEIIYHSNYPSDANLQNEEKNYLGAINYEYTILDVMIDVPSSYKFSHWNTLPDGTGESYNANEKIILSDSKIHLYAIWMNIIYYGDVNLDGAVNIDDSVVLDEYLKENTSLTDKALSNADVNVDGKVDLVDVDIIKQTSLGTTGYLALLSNEPVLIYDIYEGSINNNNGEIGPGTNNNNNNDNDNDKNNNSSTTKPNKPNNSNSNNNNNSSSNNNSTVNDGSSNVNNDNINNKDDLEKQEPDKEINNEKDDNTNNNEMNSKKTYAWVFVLVICLVSLRLIIAIIKKIIRIKNDNDNNI